MLTEDNIIWILFGSIPFAFFAAGIIMTLLASTKDREKAAVDVQRNLARNSNAFRKGHRR